jgi:hypothetical protein
MLTMQFLTRRFPENTVVRFNYLPVRSARKRRFQKARCKFPKAYFSRSTLSPWMRQAVGAKQVGLPIQV